MSKDLVLVTGGSGFLGSYCILESLRDGYRVRTTVRDLKRADEVRQLLSAGGAGKEQVQNVEFVAANLSSDQGWEEACKGCAYVLHVASPFPMKVPKDPNEHVSINRRLARCADSFRLIVPAREGTLRVLKAAKVAGTVRRVVVTSSFAAIGYGHSKHDKPFTEEDWTDLENPTSPVAPYQQSKTIAERAAWDWHAKHGGTMELAVVNPVGIFGPVLSKSYATSVELVVRLMNGDVPGLPHMVVSAVDVRDAANLHLKAMTHPEAAGQRFVCAADEGCLWTRDIALKLKHAMGDRAKKVPTRTIPNFVLRFMSYFDGTIAMIVPELGKVKDVSNEKSKRILGWEPRSVEDAVAATAESVIKLGLVK